MPSPYKLGLARRRTMNVLEVCNKKLMIIVIKHTISDTFGIFACVMLSLLADRSFISYISKVF